jgi:prepilin-type N-terminal cleavage/methylation domain-containing protein
MSASPGFTLLEVLAALVLAGVVALLVYGVADTAADTESRLFERREVLERSNAARATLFDALRSVEVVEGNGEPAFVLEDRQGPGGRPVDRISFVASGGTPPLTRDTQWRVTLEPTPAGLAMTAQPIDVAAPPFRAIAFPEVVGLDVRVRDAAGGAWLDTWIEPGVPPSAVSLTYWSDSGPAGPALVVGIPLGGLR